MPWVALTGVCCVTARTDQNPIQDKRWPSRKTSRTTKSRPRRSRSAAACWRSSPATFLMRRLPARCVPLRTATMRRRTSRPASDGIGAALAEAAHELSLAQRCRRHLCRCAQSRAGQPRDRLHRLPACRPQRARQRGSHGHAHRPDRRRARRRRADGRCAEAHEGITGVHILSHGQAGEISLGTATLNAETMSTIYRSALASIGGNLSARSRHPRLWLQLCRRRHGRSGRRPAVPTDRRRRRGVRGPDRRRRRLGSRAADWARSSPASSMRPNGTDRWHPWPSRCRRRRSSPALAQSEPPRSGKMPEHWAALQSICALR